MATSKSTGKRPTKVVKPKQTNRRSTTTFKNHRYQSFNERITKLKIDPIRRRRDNEEKEELSDERATYFGRSLARWRDLNLSQTFVSFARKAAPLSESLPQLLHNQEQILDCLIEHIEKKDALAMEPLLTLMSDFAHDLDTRFEPYFERAVKAISEVAAKHADPAVVEWSFNCLAWLFKYLSRLLTPDLRPVYNLMAPYLGREPQKPYIVRFAAESMSFLIRKAAVSYARESVQLDTIVHNILQDLVDNKHNPEIELYKQGILVLLTDAIKGVQQSMHSAGPAILRTTINSARMQQSKLATSVVQGMLTSIIHFSRAESFLPALEIIIEDCQKSDNNMNAEALFSSQLLFVVISVRKASRVRTWPAVLNMLSGLAETGRLSAEWTSETRKTFASTIAATILYCSDPTQLARAEFLNTISQGAWTNHFLGICDFVARIDHARFLQHLADRCRVFILADIRTDPETLMLLPTLFGTGSSTTVKISSNLRASLTQNLQTLADAPTSQWSSYLPLANATLEALPSIRSSNEDDVCIRQLQRRILENDSYATTSPDEDLIFVYGVLLESWLRLENDPELVHTVLERACSFSPSLFGLPRFWSNMTTLLYRLEGRAIPKHQIDLLQQAALEALPLPDHTLRERVLATIRAVYCRDSQDIPPALATAEIIESTELSLENGRSVSMHIRRLAAEYTTLEQDPFLLRAIPKYCLGLMHIRLSQAWDDSIDALGHICTNTEGENAMMDTIQRWLLNAPTLPYDEAAVQLITADEPIFQVQSDFECPNLARMAALSEQLFEEPHAGRPGLEAAFRASSKFVPTVPVTARSQALRVLNKLPQVAEKRSRLIVPTLLQWAGPQADEQQSLARWNRKDQKAMLRVVAQFQNPRVLYKSVEVHEALLHLCSNGDLEIQQAALKALQAWKTPELIRYESHFNNFLDESRFREELSVFLQGGNEDSLRESDLPTVLPVLLRLLYGRLIGGGKEGQQAKRKAVFIALSSFSSDTMAMFINIALSTTKDIVYVQNCAFQDASASRMTMPLRQQLGMLNMLGDMIETLGPALQSHVSTMLNTIIGCTVIATRRLAQSTTETEDTSLLRAVRQNGLQALYKLFSLIQVQDASSYCEVVSHELLQVRLNKFVPENSQSISATLRLISAWAKSDTYNQYLMAAGDLLLVTMAELVSAATTKVEVQIFALTQIFDELLSRDTAVSANTINHLAKSIAIVLQQQPDKHLLDACVRTLQSLAGNLQDDQTAASILGACRTLLVQPSQLVAVRTKVGLLRSMLPLLDNHASLADGELYAAVCGLFSRLHDLQARAVLSEVFTRLSTTDDKLAISKICQDLNSLDSSRLDEPDYQTREQGFVQIYDRANSWSREQWTPILHNCLHFLRDDVDTVNRASAAKALQSLISSSAKTEALLPLVQNDLFTAIQRGMAHKSEFVRAEYLGLLHSIVLQLKDWKEVADMADLTFDGDDEASFFTNVLHIQQHRRLRALRRLSEVSKVNSRNIVRIFLPLLEQFIFDQAEGDAGRTLADQAIQTIGQISRRLRWSDLRKTLLRYYGYLKTKDDLEKTVLRLIGALVDGLTFALSRAEQAVDNSVEHDDDAITTQALPQNRIDVITKEYLPPLQLFLHQKDESKVDRRVAVAISVVKLARLLPDEEFTSRLAPTLTDISHILKSRDIEAREQTRRTLSTILGIIGPIYLPFMLKELRGALLRGYQLHVLSYTVHHLLVTNGPDFKPGDIDACIPELVAVILDDIFGITGQEKDAEEYKSSTKEVKSSKSYDTMEIVARMASITSLGQLILPIRSLLQEKLDARLVKKIDDLLIRVRRGIDQNPAADTRDMLIFCHELVRQDYAQRAADGRNAGLEDWKLKKYLMQSRQTKAIKGATTSYTFKLNAFALALLRKVLRRHEDLQTPANLAGFLPMIGDGLVAGELEVKIESAKLLSTILRVELPEIDAGIDLYLKEAIAMVKGSHSTINDAARAGLELSTAILRERRDTVVRDKDVAILLRALKADIDEPDRQGQTFRFLRAVLGRKIVIPEVYEVMDDMARIMVNNPDESVRQNARAAYVQFVVDFPQGKERWAKTTAFLVKNLGFEHSGGRKSVLEVIHTLLGRLSDTAVQEILLGLFIGLVPRAVGDTDPSCRQMAEMLVQRVLEKADAEQEARIKVLASKWLQGDKKDSLRQAAVLCWTLLLRAGKTTSNEVGQLLHALSSILSLEQIGMSSSGRKLYVSALGMFLVLCETIPTRAFAQDTHTVWKNITDAVSAGSDGSCDMAVRLLAMLYNDVASTTAKGGMGLQSTRLESSAGLVLGVDFWCDGCAVHLRCLRKMLADQSDLINSISKNLVLLGRIFAANEMAWRHGAAVISAQEDSDAENDEEDSDNEVKTRRETSALGYLFSRLSYIVRREDVSSTIRIAALQTAATLTHVIEKDIPNLELLVRPLYVLTDASIPQPSGDEHKMLVDKARETLEVVQSKVGSQKYIEMLTAARKDVGEKRDERRRKRRIEAVSQPERWAKEKRRRHIAEKVRTKAKSDGYRSQRRGW